MTPTAVQPSSGFSKYGYPKSSFLLIFNSKPTIVVGISTIIACSPPIINHSYPYKPTIFRGFFQETIIELRHTAPCPGLARHPICAPWRARGGAALARHLRFGSQRQPGRGPRVWSMGERMVA